MKIASGNLLDGLPKELDAEQVDRLAGSRGVRIERIVSMGQASPPDFWYDQDYGEWVLLLAGAAHLRFADEAAARELEPGDWIAIPAHARHRVEWTDPAVATVWLAVHYDDEPAPPVGL